MFRFLILSWLILTSFSLSAQTLDDINTTRFRHSMNGSIVLTSWAGANIIAGTVGYYATPTGEWKHFHEMNVYWNIVNLGLGIPGLFAKKDKQMGLTLEQTVKRQYQTETIFLFNGALDLTYITAGVLLREMGSNHTDQATQERWKGFGTSLIAQGGFLLLFDFVKYGVHKINSKKIDSHWKNLSVSPHGVYGLGLAMQYNF